MSQLSQPPVVLKHLWNVLFALFYPALVVFSLLFTGLLLIFSNISRLAFAVIKLFSKKKGQENDFPKRKAHSHHHHH